MPLLGCRPENELHCKGDCETGEADTDSGAPDSHDSAEPDDSHGGDDSAETAETGHGETGESGETAETGEPWDPNKPLELCINEFMPDDNASVADDLGAYSDWIELHNPGEETVALAGWTMTDDGDDPTDSALDSSLSIEPGGFLLLYADGDSSLGAQHLDMKLSKDGGSVGLYAPDGRGSLINYGSVVPDISVARVTDCCSGEGCWEFVYGGTPGSTNAPPEPEELELVPAGSTWRYWDGVDEPPGDWTSASYDDSAWDSGAGPLGYGDAHIVTTLDYGGDDANKNITAWFRLSFTATDVDTYTSAMGGLLADDGAIVYLNGAEVERSNMPDGDVDATTLASSSTSDETGYGAFTVDPTGLLEGDNVLAAEVHQHSADSSDLGFDLKLEAEYYPE